MQITSSYYQSAACPPTTVKDNKDAKAVSSSFIIAKVDNSLSKNQDKDVWVELKQKYDIRHCTFRDLCDISNSLYSSGDISLKEHLMITFDWKKAAEGLSERYPGAKTDLNWTPADANGNRDWIDEFKARASYNMKHGDMDNYVRDTNLAKTLGRLER